MVTVSAIGHSYFVSLKDHLQGKLTDSHSHLHAEIPGSIFSLSDHVKHLYLGGVRGCFVKHLREQIHFLEQTRANLVLVEIATNDLADSHHSDSQILTLANTVHQFALELVNNKSLHIQHVLIFQCLKRTRRLGIQSPSQYENSAKKYNKYLKDLCTSTPAKTTYCHHTGFWQNKQRQDISVKLWSQDGIHPNSVYGRHHYIKSLRKYILRGLKYCK